MKTIEMGTKNYEKNLNKITRICCKIKNVRTIGLRNEL